jgi:Ferritin-like domain
MKTELLERIVNSPSDRRKFMKRVGATGIGVAAAIMLGGSLGKIEAATTITDADILNFALNLEYLEGEFYSVATTGQTLVQLGIIPPSAVTGPTTGGSMVNFSGSSVAFVASALASDEQTHVRFLRSVLGTRAAVKKPAINLDALGYGFASVNDFLKLARQFEDVGVSAYLGAAPLIQSKIYLAKAAAIMATEAQHSGSVRLECIDNGVVSPAVDSLDVPPTMQTPYDVNADALSIPRTTAQVLNIVYAGGKCSGGFYPDGMNGTIVCQ